MLRIMMVKMALIQASSYFTIMIRKNAVHCTLSSVLLVGDIVCIAESFKRWSDQAVICTTPHEFFTA